MFILYFKALNNPDIQIIIIIKTYKTDISNIEKLEDHKEGRTNLYRRLLFNSKLILYWDAWLNCDLMMLASNYFTILLILSFFLVFFVWFWIARKYDYQQPQNQADSVQLSLEWILRKWATQVIVKQYSSKLLILLNHAHFLKILFLHKIILLVTFLQFFWSVLFCFLKFHLWLACYRNKKWFKKPENRRINYNQRYGDLKTSGFFRVQSGRNENPSLEVKVWSLGYFELNIFAKSKKRKSSHWHNFLWLYSVVSVIWITDLCPHCCRTTL